MYSAVTASLRGLSWFQRTIIVGAVLTILWMSWDLGGLEGRVIRDGLLFLLIPLALGVTHGRHIGWTINRRAIRNAVLLSLFVVPFYVVGSTLPTIREYYPMFGLTSLALVEFLPHAVGQFTLALAAETYYRGLLCVGIRERGFWVVFISPLLYMLHHYGKPPIEFLLSGPADVLFGVADYDANSILPSVCAHGLGLTLLDILVLRPPIIDPETTLRWLDWLPVPL